MFSYIRKPSSSLSINSDDTSFSSDNFHLPSITAPPPSVIRQLVIHDLDNTNFTDFTLQRSMEREPFRIPRPMITIPQTPIHLPEDDDSFWIHYPKPYRLQPSPSISNQYSVVHHAEQPLYQNVSFRSSMPPVPVPVQYHITSHPHQQQYAHIPIVRPIRDKRYTREKPAGLITTLSIGGFGSLAALIYLSFLFALPLAKLIVGILYVKECPLNKNIPVYMIVSGACGLAIVILLIFSSACIYIRAMSNARKAIHGFIICTIAVTRALQGVIAIFLFIWFIVGNVLVFNARARVRTDKTVDTTNYCHPTLYWFAYYVLIFTYVYAVLTCCFKFCANFFCCGALDACHKAFS